MKKIAICLLLLLTLAIPVSASELTAPQAPDSVQQLLPREEASFGEDLWYVISRSFTAITPDLQKAVKICFAVLGTVMLLSVLQGFCSMPSNTVRMTGTVVLSILLMSCAGALIREGSETVNELSEYGKLLLPVMSAALASQGGVTTATATFAFTAMFDSVLCGLISRFLVPMVYIFLTVSVSCCAIGDQILKKLKELVKWAVTWCLKTALYIFTGYITVSGVISGVTDQTALKVTKLTISGMVPVVGGILSDASEAVLVGAGVVKNAAGIYGILALAAIFMSPFLKIGVHYLLLKLTAIACSVFADTKISELINDFSAGMGLLLAVTGSVCLLLMISTVCMMKGLGG